MDFEFDIVIKTYRSGRVTRTIRDVPPRPGEVTLPVPVLPPTPIPETDHDL